MMKEKLYFTPTEFSGLSDAAAIQAAVDAAIRADIRVVRIPGKADGTAWTLDHPVRLPSFTTLLLDGACIWVDGTAFTNSHATETDTRSLAGEEQGIHIQGRNGAKIIGTHASQVVLINAKKCVVRGITFVDGAGLRLEHVRYSKVQNLRFLNCVYGVSLAEGCCNNLLEDMEADTVREAVCWSATTTTVWGRSPDMYDSSLCRIRAKTQGAPAVTVDPGPVSVYNLFLRDIWDETADSGVSVVIGGGSDSQLQDVSIRNVKSKRIPARVNACADGIFLCDLEGEPLVIHESATRVLVESEGVPFAHPQFSEYADTAFITPNDPAYFGATDGETIQNAVNAAAAAGVKLVIPRQNVRTGQMRWDMDRTVILPDHSYVELLDAHLRQVDFTYCNMFTNGEGANHITVCGIGNALVDTGRPNGLKKKNAGKLGFGPITDNATFLFRDVTGLTVRDLAIHQSRWYSIYCLGCTTGRIADVDLYAPPIFPDLGGIQLRSGCRDILIENITGLSGEDLILIATQACDAAGGRRICNIHIRNILANASRCYILDILCHDEGYVENILAETLLDNSLAEQKKQPAATVRIGHSDGYYKSCGRLENIRGITVRDINGRGASTLELGGCSSNVKITNLHSFGSSENSIRTALPPECSDYLMASISADPSVIQVVSSAVPMTQIRGWEICGVFFRCAQASRYMRGTATSIITDKKKYIGMVLQLDGLKTDDLVVRNVLVDRAGQGVRLTGAATVEITGFEAAELGREVGVCGGGCRLLIDGKQWAVTSFRKN